MAKRRILIVTDSFNIGGSERQALELFRNMDRTKFDLRLASFSTNGPLATLLPCPMDDVQVYPLTGFYRKSYLDQARRFYRYLTAERIEVVQCFDFYSNLFAIPVHACWSSDHSWCSSRGVDVENVPPAQHPTVLLSDRHGRRGQRWIDSRSPHQG